MAREGLTPTELAAALRQLENPSVWIRELRKEYRRVGTLAARWARQAMLGMDPRVARAAAAVRGASTATAATLSVSSRTVRGALAAVWGTKKSHTGWAAGWVHGQINPNRAAGYAATKRNTLQWRGNDFEIGVAGQGPRGLNDSVAEHKAELTNRFLDAGMAVIGRAIPLHRK